VKPALRLRSDYWLVSEEVWYALVERFKASPELSCTILDDGTPELYPLELSARYRDRTETLKLSRTLSRADFHHQIESRFDISPPYEIRARNSSTEIYVTNPIGQSFDGNTRIDICPCAVPAPSARAPPVPATPPAASQPACGLRNIGNSCYLNASLQALLSIASLRDGLERILCDGGKLTRGFVELALAMRETRTVADPSPFKRVFGQSVPAFAGTAQQDAHEFTTFLLDKLTTECPRPAFLHSLFFGQIENLTVCSNCQNSSAVLEDFSAISLPVAESRRVVWSPYILTEPLQRLPDLPDVPAVLIGRDPKGKNIITNAIHPSFVEIVALEAPEPEPGFAYACVGIVAPKCRIAVPLVLVKVALAVELSGIELYEIFQDRLAPLIGDSPFRFESPPTIFTVENDEDIYCQEKVKVTLVDREFVLQREMSSSLLALPELLRRYFREMSLDLDNQWRCPACGEDSCALHSMRLCQAPPHLILHLKRFGVKAQTLARDDSEVIIPESIELGEFFKEPAGGEVVYKLTAIVNHMGSLRAGHYTAFGRRNGNWLYFNDATVTERARPPGGSAAPYLLFYSRIE
jgi:ubiquitin C-terminal hydrolase